MNPGSFLTGILGIRLTLWLGKVVATTAPVFIIEALREATVSLSDKGKDGFQLTFATGRAGVGVLDNLLVASPLLRPFNRVILQIWFGPFPEVLIDGIITRHELHSTGEPGGSSLTVTGEDLRVLMDMDETTMSYPNMAAEERVQLLLLKYMSYLGMPAMTITSRVPDRDIMTDRIPVQASTDLRYIERLAEKNGYVFYIEPVAPMLNQAYWGPAGGLPFPPQSALSVNAGPDSNVDDIRFGYDALKPTMVMGTMQDKRTGLPMPVATLPMTRPPTTLLPAVLAQQPNVRRVFPKRSSSLDPLQAIAYNQAITDDSNDAVDARGELDPVRYGHVLRARRKVGVRGVGLMHDGEYLVKKVTHTIKRGEYRQSFELVRDGHGPLTPMVLP